MKKKLSYNIFFIATSLLLLIGVILANVVLYALTDRFDWHIAYTEEIDFDISGNTDDLFKKAIADGRKVDIIFCMPEDELALHTTGKDVLNTAKQFEERYPDLIDLKFYNIGTMQDENGEITDFKKYKVNGIGQEVDLHKGAVIFSSVVRDEAGLEREDFTVLNSTSNTGVPFLDFYHIDAEGYITAYNGEETLASRILWTLTDEHKIAYFTSGHGESIDITMLNMVTSAGYYSQELDLVRTDLYRSSTITDPEELKNKKGLDLDRAGLVIISNPTADFAKGGETVYTEIDKLEDYLSEGGALYVSLDPYAPRLSNLEGMLSEWGMVLSASIDSDGKTVRNIVKDTSGGITTDEYTFVANYADNDIGDALSEKTDKYVPGAVLVKNMGDIVLSGSAKPVLISSSFSSTVADGKEVDGKGKYCVAALSEKTVAGKTGRIFMISGVYLTASDAVISDSYANRNFSYAVFDEIFDASCAPYGCKLVPYTSGRLENLTMGSARIYTVLIMAVPVILAVGGIVINKRRKNR